MQGIKRRRSGSANRELSAIDPAISPSKLLDLVHVTAVGAAREIVHTGQIEMRGCRVFGKDLVYFFVARPCYRQNQGNQKSEQINRFPFVFVVSPENLNPPYHVYPFDTGGATEGLFDDFADPYVFLEDYELDPNLVAAARHIQWAFGGPEKYFDGDLRVGLANAIENWKAVALGFLRIAGLAASSHNRPDKRASAIEVAYNCNIPLNGNAKFAVIPKQYLENGSATNKAFIERLTALGIDWDTYEWQPNTPPDFYSDEINRKVRQYLKRTNQF